MTKIVVRRFLFEYPSYDVDIPAYAFAMGRF